jgi:hypothetical protein
MRPYHNFWHGLKFAIPISLILWALFVWLVMAMVGCAGDVGDPRNALSAPLVPVITAPPTTPAPPVTETPPPPITPPPVTETSDDTAELQADLNAGGMTQLAGRIYHTTKSLIYTQSGSGLIGTVGTVIDFTPPPKGTARDWCVNDRAIAMQCGLSTTGVLPIANAISVGATSFTVVNLADVADLNPGDWIIVTDTDPSVADASSHTGYPTYVDWAQVASVVGTTVNVVTPFRMAFDASLPFIEGDSGLGFVKTTALHDIVLESLTLKVEEGGAGAAGIYILGTQGALIKNVTIVDTTSDQLYVEQSKGTTVTGCNITGGALLNEFAESVDLTISENTFTSQGLAIGLDLGTGFFSVTDNTIAQSVHVAMYAVYHVHDGVISGNIIDPVTTITSDPSVGIVVYGSPGVSVTGNTLLGVDGSNVGSIGVQMEGRQADLSELATGDNASGNNITGFATAQAVYP